MKPLHEQVVVITGASAGIGRCAALHLAARGARIVAFARGEEHLRTLVEEIRAAGGEATYVTGDVASEADVDRLGDVAVETYGAIDTWVNNAAVFIQGRFEEIEPADFRRMIDVDLLGVVNGTRRALRQMREQGEPGSGGEGVVILVSSILGERGAAHFSPYSTAKRALAGFGDALRTELWGTGIHMSTLYLPTMDTAIYQHAKAAGGTLPRPAPPVQRPEKAARAIAELAVTGAIDKHISLFHWLFAGVDRVSSRLGDFLLHRARHFALTDEPAPTGGNLYHETRHMAGVIHGGWGHEGWKGFTVRGVVRVLPTESLLLAGVLGFVAGGFLGGEDTEGDGEDTEKGI